MVTPTAQNREQAWDRPMDRVTWTLLGVGVLLGFVVGLVASL